MTTYSNWFIFLGTVVLLTCNCRADDFSFRLNRSSIEPGERATLEVRLPIDWLTRGGWQEEDEPPSINDELLTQSEDIRVLESDYRRENDAIYWTYQLTAYDAGSHRVPPVEIQAGPHSFSTEAKSIDVTSTRAPNDGKLRDEFSNTSNFPWKKILWLCIALVLGYFLIRTAIKYFPRINWPKKKFQITPSPIPAKLDNHAWLKQQFSRIRELLPHADEHVIDDLTEVLKEFFSRECEQPARMWTTREFKCRFADNQKARSIGSVFETCDLIKFANQKVHPISDFVRDHIGHCEEVLLCGT